MTTTKARVDTEEGFSRSLIVLTFLQWYAFARR